MEWTMMVDFPIKTSIVIPDAPWYWNIYLHRTPQNGPNVGKYSSTMVRIWAILAVDTHDLWKSLW